MDIRIGTFDWKQVGGDINPGTYGGTIARGDGHAIELLKIQPVREYVGDNEAQEVGFPFWTRTGYFDAADLNPERAEVQEALATTGLERETLADMTPSARAIAIAEALLEYGYADEGPSGWARDVVPGRVAWWGGKRRSGWRYIADEDVEFRRMLREQ